MSKVMLYGKRTLDFMCLLISHSSGDVAHQLMTLGFLLLPLLSFSWCNKAPAPAPAGLASQLDAPVPVMGVTQSWPDGTTPKTNLSPACASPAHDQRGYNIIFKTCPVLSCPVLVSSALSVLCPISEALAFRGHGNTFAQPNQIVCCLFK